MRSILASVLVVGLAAFTAAGQTTPPTNPTTDPAADPAAESPRPAKHLAPPEHSKLIGQPIAPPPITSWPVGEAVTEFKPGTVYLFSLAEPIASGEHFGGADHRHYLAQIQSKYKDVVVVEVIGKDDNQWTLAGERVPSAANDPQVRTRVGVWGPTHSPGPFEKWCGQMRGLDGFIAAVVDGDGRLACVVEAYRDLPWVLDHVTAGTFDNADYVKAIAAERAIVSRQPRPKDPSARLAEIDESLKLAPWRSVNYVTRRARELSRDGHVEEAAGLVRKAIADSPIIDRWWMRDILRLQFDHFSDNSTMRPVLLDAAKTLAATSDLENVNELEGVAHIANSMRDFDTAIEYQTLAVARAQHDRQRDEAIKKLREYEAAKAK